MLKKLRNKETREIGYLYANKDVNYQVLDENDEVLAVYDTLPRLIEEWEDCKVNIWYNSLISGRHTIEIDFPTEKEAKKAMQQLNAWERLKDKGFRFTEWDFNENQKYRTFVCFLDINKSLSNPKNTDEIRQDLDLLFGGEE